MATQVFINQLPLDQGRFVFPMYRGTEARAFTVYGFGPRWPEYEALVKGLQGGFARLRIVGSRIAGPRPGRLELNIPDIIVLRATLVNELSVELECYDSRLLLREVVNALDFNMLFGGDYLEGTAKTDDLPYTYAEAIRRLCEADSRIASRMAADAYAAIPDRTLESNVHLSALLATDPLGYLCDRAGCDLAIELETGKWYFASREDASPQWFQGFEAYNWRVRPGFMALATYVTRRPRKINCYYWEHHTLRVEGVDSGPRSTRTPNTYGPASNKVSLEQVYRDDESGAYLSLEDLLTAHNLSGTADDATIAAAFLSDSAKGTGLHPLDTFARKVVWGIIRRDWRRLWRITFPQGSTGGWDQWRFGKIQEDGSVEPVSVECPWVEFTRVIQSDRQGNLENLPWTFNHTASNQKTPFVATWDNGPESGVIRLVVQDSADRMRDLIPPLPGALTTTRDGVTDDALKIVRKNAVSNGEKSADGSAIDHLDLVAREDISKGRLLESFRVAVYLTARRFMPNTSARWQLQTAEGFSGGDIDSIDLPPGDEVQAYRTYVGGDHSDTALWFASDGLGITLNADEVREDAERRAEVWKLTHCLSAAGEGHADTLNIAKRTRLIDGPIQEVELHAEKDGDAVETFALVRVGNLADNKARSLTAAKRLASRRLDVQGVRR